MIIRSLIVDDHQHRLIWRSSNPIYLCFFVYFHDLVPLIVPRSHNFTVLSNRARHTKRRVSDRSIFFPNQFWKKIEKRFEKSLLLSARPIEFSKVGPIKQENSAGNPCQSRWSEIISGPGGKGKKFRVQLSAEWIFRIKHQTWRLSLFQRALTCSRHELYIHITCTLKLKFKTWIPFTSWIVFKNRFEIFLRMLARRIEFSEVKILFRISK